MPHGMGTFDYNHWGTLEHFSFPLLHQSRLPAHFPGVASCWILHYHIFYLSAFASVKNCTIHCCYLSCLAKWFSKWQRKRIGLLFLRKITLSEVKVPSISALVLFLLCLAHLSEDHLRVSGGFAGNWAEAFWLLLTVIYELKRILLLYIRKMYIQNHHHKYTVRASCCSLLI